MAFNLNVERSFGISSLNCVFIIILLKRRFDDAYISNVFGKENHTVRFKYKKGNAMFQKLFVPFTDVVKGQRTFGIIVKIRIFFFPCLLLLLSLLAGSGLAFSTLFFPINSFFSYQTFFFFFNESTCEQACGPGKL